MNNYKYKIDFQDVKLNFQQLSRGNQLNVLKHFAFGGEIAGGDYVVRCPWRNDIRLGSFKVKLSTGCYHDFATGEHGDIISFVAKCEGSNLYEATSKLMNLMGNSFLASSYNDDCLKKEPAKKKKDYTLFIWGKSTKQRHLYLERKSITIGNARVNVYKNLKRIVVPMTDSIPEKESKLNVKALQFIHEDGEKKFKLSMKGLFHIASEYDCDKSVVIICEGFATARSIVEALPNVYVIACMSAYNMKPVALRIRELLPDSRILLAGDKNANEVGQKAVEKSFLALGINCNTVYPEQGIDFNDMLIAVGVDNLKIYLTKKLNNINKEITYGQY